MEKVSTLADCFEMLAAERKFTKLNTCRIGAKNLPEEGEIKIPETLIIDGNQEISMKEFRGGWALTQTFSPIIIGFGIEIKDYEALDDDFFVGLKVELENGALYIVDPTRPGHERCVDELKADWRAAFRASFHNWDALGNATGTADFGGMQADASWTISPRFQPPGIFFPFLIVEVGWSQSSASLREKINRWLDFGVLFAIGLEKNLATGETYIFYKERFSDETEDWIIPSGEWADFTIRLKKRLLFERYPIEQFDLDPNSEFIHLPVNGYFEIR